MPPRRLIASPARLAVPARVAIVGAAAALFAAPLAAQGTTVPPIPNDHPAMQRALATLRADNAWTLEQQRSICEIPSPPLKEAARAAEYKRRLQALGLRNVRIDAEGNVIGERPGAGTGPTVVRVGAPRHRLPGGNRRHGASGRDRHGRPRHRRRLSWAGGAARGGPRARCGAGAHAGADPLRRHGGRGRAGQPAWRAAPARAPSSRARSTTSSRWTEPASA